MFPLIQAFTFTAGMSILMTGVRMFLSEITSAFVAVSEKFIPNSRPALDVPTVFPYAPTAVIVGFISSYTCLLYTSPLQKRQHQHLHDLVQPEIHLLDQDVYKRQ